jgi:hypothetical protein
MPASTSFRQAIFGRAFEIDNAFPILMERGVGALIVIADLASSVYRR